MSNLIESWKFAYHSSLNIQSLPLPNGDEIPLPPRKMWTGGARVIVSLTENENNKSYYITITEDVYLETESEHAGGLIKNHGPGFVARSLAKKFVTGFGGKFVGGVAGIVVGVFIPSDIAKEKFWRTKSSNDIPVTIVILGF